jgi:uncharacterized membrane protein YdcZ (DUF606 family)
MPDSYLTWLVMSGVFGIVMVTVGAVSDPSHGPLTAVGVVGLMPSAVVVFLWGIHAVKDDAVKDD